MTYDDWYAFGRDVLAPMGKGLNWWIGDWLAYGEHQYGEKYAQATTLWPDHEAQTLRVLNYVSAAVLIRNQHLSWTHHRMVAALSEKEQRVWLGRAEREDWDASELRRQLNESKALAPPKARPGLYRTVVIDPPWPVEKIEREVRPNQAAPLDYRTLELETIKAGTWYNGAGKLPFDGRGCHVYLWVTQKYLPAGLECLQTWGVDYQCTLTWVKNVGFTPFSWMYSTEHVLFGHVGSLPLEQKGLRLDFKGNVREHSRKPDEFYELVTKASPGPRLDMFAREKRDGFELWGNETGRFET
jgi:N6-adenosine-specific RNA methylase IME4